MKFASWVVLIAFVLVTGSGCSHSRAHIKYSEFSEMSLKQGAQSGTNLGPISGEDGGAVWSDCTEKARGSVRELIAEARLKGGNAIGDIKWAGDRTEPTCKKGWGYVILWPFLLTPLFMSTQATGNAYKTSGGASTGFYLLPENPSDDGKLVDKILAQN